jgi:hypothetical protein
MIREALNKPLFRASFIGVGGGIPELVQTFLSGKGARLGEDAHALDPAAGDDPDLEAVRPQVCEQLERRWNTSAVGGVTAMGGEAGVRRT